MNAPILHGERYLTPRAKQWGLDKFILEELHGCDLDETLDFYRQFRQFTKDPQEAALLAANDRFFLSTQLMHRKDCIHPWVYDRCREVENEPDGCLDLWARGHMKAVDLNEPVPTPLGMRRHGDLQPGDEVFGPDGKPATVVGKTPVFTNSDCYRVLFDDGYSVVVNGDHLWAVDVHSKKRINKTDLRDGVKPMVFNTRYLMGEVEDAKSKKSHVLPRVRMQQAVEHAHAALPIHPYVLGVWLGDGTCKQNAVTSGWHDVDDMEANILACGHSVSRASHSNSVTLRLDKGIRGKKHSSPFTMSLRALGIYRVKRIPKAYLHASIEQRWALLQGLMDTDGHCHKKHSQAMFTNANFGLASDFLLLASSLGIKASIAERRPLYKGLPRSYWQVQFKATMNKPVFRLKRKLAFSSTGPVQQTAYRRIVKVERVESIPVSCIQVDRADGLYLIGTHFVTTHNSSLITQAGTVQELIRDPEMTICIFSYNRPIAAKFLVQIKGELERNQDLRNACPDVFWQKPRSDAPVWSVDGGLTVIRTGNPKEASVEAHGLDSQPVSKHFKLLIYNDVVVRKSVTNSTQVEKTTENWELSDNIGVGEKTRKWHEGTRYDLADTYATLIERKLFHVRLYPATHNGRLDGKPVFLSQERWDKIKKTQRRTVAAQMLQNPAAGNEQMFDMAWLLPYEIRPGRVHIYIMVDPASSMKKESDRTAMAVVAIDENGNKYFVDGLCHKLAELDRWKELRRLHEKWSNVPSVELVEVGYEKYGAQADVGWMKQRMIDSNYHFEIKELNWPRQGEHSKVDRVGRLQPDISGSEYRFYFPAVVWRPNAGDDAAGGMCFWHYNVQKNEFVYSPAEKLASMGFDEKGVEHFTWTGEMILTRAMRGVDAMGEPFRKAKPIVRKDEEGNLYDCTMRLFEELRVFPKKRGHDDLADALSRLFDMDYQRPMKAAESGRIEAAGPAH